MENSALKIIIEAKNRTQKPFSDAQKGLKKLSKGADNLSKRMKKTGDAFQKAGRSMRLASLAVAGGFAVAVKTAISFEKKLSDVSTLMSGDSTQAIADLKDSIRGLAKQYGILHNDLATSAYFIYSAGITDATRATETLEASSILAATGLGTLEQSTDLMTSAMNAFQAQGITANQAAEAFFIAVKNGKTTVAELAQGFGATAPLMSSLGVEFTEFTRITAAGTTAGNKAAEVYVQMKSALTGLLKPTDDLKKVYKKLGVTTGKELIKQQGGLINALDAVRKTGGEMGLQLADMFGNVRALSFLASEEGEKFADAYAQGAEDIANGSALMNEALDKQMNTTEARLNRFRLVIADLGITIGDKLSPAIGKAADVLTRFVNVLNSADPRLANMILAFGAMVIAAGPALLIIGKLITAFGTLVSIVKVVGVAIGALMGPVGLIVAAVAVAVAIIIRNWESIWPVVQEFGQAVWGLFESMWPFIKGIFSAIVIAIRAAFIILETIFKVNLALWKAIVLPIVKFFAKVFETVFRIVKSVIDAFTPLFQGAWTIIKAVFGPVVGFFSGIFGQAFGYVSSIFGNLINKVVEGLEWLAPKFETAATFITNIFKRAFDFVVRIFNNTLGRIDFKLPDWLGGHEFKINKLKTTTQLDNERQQKASQRREYEEIAATMTAARQDGREVEVVDTNAGFGFRVKDKGLFDDLSSTFGDLFSGDLFSGINFQTPTAPESPTGVTNNISGDIIINDASTGEQLIDMFNRNTELGLEGAPTDL